MINDHYHPLDLSFSSELFSKVHILIWFPSSHFVWSSCSAVELETLAMWRLSCLTSRLILLFLSFYRLMRILAAETKNPAAPSRSRWRTRTLLTSLSCAPKPKRKFLSRILSGRQKQWRYLPCPSTFRNLQGRVALSKTRILVVL